MSDSSSTIEHLDVESIRGQIKHTKNFSIKRFGSPKPPPKILYVWAFSCVLKRKEAPNIKNLRGKGSLEMGSRRGFLAKFFVRKVLNPYLDSSRQQPSYSEASLSVCLSLSLSLCLLHLHSGHSSARSRLFRYTWTIRMIGVNM